MKRRRYIAWTLMMVSIIMLAASVLPHHHHREVLCLQHDVTICDCHCSDKNHHNEATDENHTCNAGCVTKFHSISPDRAQDTVTPDYSFCLLMYTWADVFDLPLCPIENKTKQYTSYLEKLHPTCLPHVTGLRAPPYVLA